jgi:hypothetical protein
MQNNCNAKGANVAVDAIADLYPTKRADLLFFNVNNAALSI